MAVKQDSTAVNGTEPTVLKKVPYPNKQEYDSKIDVIDKDVKQLKDKIQALEKQIDARSKGKEDFFNQKTQIKGDMDVYDNKISGLENTKKELVERMRKLVSESKQARKDFNDMEKKLGFKTEQEVDDRIAELEYQMHVETLTLKREKELMSKIAQLKQTKPQIKKLNRMSESNTSGGVEDNIGAIKAEIEKINKQLNEQRDERRVHSNKFRSLLDDRKKATEGLPELFEQKKALKEQVSTKMGEIRALRDEKNSKIREYNDYIRAQKKIREESDEKYRAAREAEAERAKLANELENEDMLPFSDEVDLIQNTIKYCESLMPSDNTAVEETKAEELNSLEGTVALVSKKDREEEFFFNPTKGKKGKKQNKSSKPTSKTLKYDLTTMSLFQRLNIDAPSKADDLSGTVTVLEGKLEELKKKQLSEVEERKAKRSEREKALAEATEKAKAAQEMADEAWKRNAALSKTEKEDKKASS